MQEFSYNQVAHLNVRLQEQQLHYKLLFTDPKTIEVEPLGVCACSGQEARLQKAVKDYFEQEGICVYFSEDSLTIHLYKTIAVVAAVIRGTGSHVGKIFATQRGYGEFKDGWEFPGGKMEKGETPQQALKREIQEELNTEIQAGEFLVTVEYDYPNFHLSMQCFYCNVVHGELELLEHEASRWLSKEELDEVDWLPADIEVVEEIRKRL